MDAFNAYTKRHAETSNGGSAAATWQQQSNHGLVRPAAQMQHRQLLQASLFSSM